MKIRCAFLAGCVLLGLFASAGPAAAQDKRCSRARDGSTVCPPPDSSCLTNRQGEVVCSAPGGGIALDRYGDAACGPGYCTKDVRGDLFCSSAPRGAAGLDRYGAAACTSGCVAASRQACVKPEPASK